MYSVSGVSDLSHDEALFLAAVSIMDEDKMSELIDNGVNISCRHPHGQTALHLAAYNGHEEITRTLIQNNIDLDTQNKNGQTALHLSAGRGFLPVVTQLVEASCDINLTTKASGMTALHLATINSEADVIQYLLKNEADQMLQDSIGKVAEYYAKTERIKKLFRHEESNNMTPDDTGLITDKSDSAITNNQALHDRGTTVESPSEGADDINVGGKNESEELNKESRESGENLRERGPRKKFVPPKIERNGLKKIVDAKFEFSEEHKQRMRLSVYDRLAGKK